MSAPERMMPPVIFADPRGVWDIPTDERTNEGQVMFWRHDRCIPLTDPALTEVREALSVCIDFAERIADAADIDMETTSLTVRVMPGGKIAGSKTWSSIHDDARAAIAKLDALMMPKGGV
jgi:hypothetical protein